MFESEVQCALYVAQVVGLNGYEIVSKCVYGGSSRASQKFSELGGDKKSGSFDLIIKDNKTGFLTGIEIKLCLNSKSFHGALGQCQDYLAESRNKKCCDILRLWCAKIQAYMSGYYQGV
jgi:hypothetical protein